MRPRGRLLAASIALAATVASAADAPADVQVLRTRSLAATCGACHVSAGRATSPSAPAGLAGMPATELIGRMRAFKNGTRAGTVMPQLAQGFSDAQIDQLARWFAVATPDAR
jgi:cytochrome c553